MSRVFPAAFGVFALSMAAVISEKVNKTTAALLGAMVMIGIGVVGQGEAFAAVDWNVIFLLIGMMIITNVAKRTGLFQYLAIKVAKFARGEPVAILLLLAVTTAAISAVLDNVTTVLIIVPITFLIAVELGVSPTPFVVTLAMASNVGGTATLIGDPPNVMIGSAAGLGFVDFLANTAPVVVVNLAALCLFAFVAFGKGLKVTNARKARVMAFDDSKAIEDRPLMIKSLAVLGLVVLAFLLHPITGLEPATVAMGGAALLLLVAGYKEIDEILGEIEWTTVLFFVGLFIIVAGLVETGAMAVASEALLRVTGGRIRETGLVMLWGSGILSAAVDNIPFVATMIPLIQDMGSSLGAEAVRPLWWALSLGACLGGNGTLIGASANVISVGISRKSGFPVSFWEFTKYGALFTVLSLAVSTAYLAIRY